MHCTGVGKAILAHMSPERMHAVISEQGMAQYTQNTITDLAELEIELEKIRRQGYAVDNMEYEWGIRCIAVPIRNEIGVVHASMSISVRQRDCRWKRLQNGSATDAFWRGHFKAFWLLR